MVLQTNNIDHHRTADFPAFAGGPRRQARGDRHHARCFDAPAILLIGNDPTEQHPLLAWQIRNNVRLHRSRLYADQLAGDQAAPAGGGLRAGSQRARKEKLQPSSPATIRQPTRSRAT